MGVKFITPEIAEHITTLVFSDADVFKRIEVKDKDKFYRFLINYITEEEGNQLLYSIQKNKIDRFIYLLLKFGFELFHKDGGKLKIPKEKRELYMKWILLSEDE